MVEKYKMSSHYYVIKKKPLKSLKFYCGKKMVV